jgi:4-aminobutyrate aminotransferase
MPLGATVSKASVMTWPSGAHANTYGGNPVALAAASATLDLIEGGLMKQAAVVGDYFLRELQRLMDVHELIGDVRGKGLMIGIELVKDRETKVPGVEEKLAVIQGCFESGLLLLGCGESSVRFSPALTATKAHVDRALTVLAEVLTKIGRKKR